MKELLKKWYYPEELSGNESGSSRNYYLDNLKFILIILVVIGHFTLQIPGIKWVRYIQYFIYTFHMPCFIFVSGYLAKRMNEGGKLKADKVLGIFWLYLLFKIGNVLLQVAFGININFDLFKGRAAPWYLLALGIWYLMIPLLERIKPNYLIAGTFLIGLAAGYTSNINSIFTLSRVIVFLPFFSLGFLWSGKLDVFLNKKLRIQALLLMIALMVVIILFWNQLKPFKDIVYGASSYNSSLGKYAKYGLMIRGIWYLLAIIISGAFMLLIPRCKTFFSVLGERTLQVYMTHIWFRNAIGYAGFFVYLKGLPQYYNALVLLGSVILTFLLANRWFKKIFDFLSAPALFKKLLR